MADGTRKNASSETEDTPLVFTNADIIGMLQRLSDRMSNMELAINTRKEEIRSIAKNFDMVTSDESERENDEESRVGNDDALFVEPEQLLEREQIDPRLLQRLSNERVTTPNEAILTTDRLSQSPNERISTTSENIPARDAVKLIKKFNGQDDMGVEPFITLVKRIKSQCSNPGVLLDWIIAEKIEGEAEKSIRFLSIQDYDDLFKALRTNFGTTGSLETHRTKLSQVIQGAGESTQNFNARFNQRMHELLYAVQSKNPLKHEREICIKNEEQTVLEKYIMNLREELSDRVASKNPSDVREAQQMAIQSEVWLDERSKIHQSKNTIKPQLPIRTTLDKSPFKTLNSQFNKQKYPSLNNPPNHSIPLQQRLQLFCRHYKIRLK